MLQSTLRSLLRSLLKQSLLLQLTALFLLAGTAGASDLVLNEVLFIQTDQGEQVHFILSAYSPPKIFGIEGTKPRVVCDFDNATLAKEVKRTIETQGKMVKNVRIGVHTAPDKKVRVVLDLVPGPDYDIQQTYSVEKSRYTIMVDINKGAVATP